MPRTSRPIFKISCSTIRVNRRETNNQHGRGASAPPPRSGLISDETHSVTFSCSCSRERGEEGDAKIGSVFFHPSEPLRNTKNQGRAFYFFGALTSFDACTSTTSGGARSHASRLASLLLFSVYIFPLSVYFPPGFIELEAKFNGFFSKMR